MNCKCNGHTASNKWHHMNKQVNAQNNHMSGEYSTRQNRKIDILFLWVIGLNHAVRKKIWLRADFF
jgi:ribosomal protein L20